MGGGGSVVFVVAMQWSTVLTTSLWPSFGACHFTLGLDCIALASYVRGPRGCCYLLSKMLTLLIHFNLLPNGEHVVAKSFKLHTEIHKIIITFIVGDGTNRFLAPPDFAVFPKSCTSHEATPAVFLALKFFSCMHSEQSHSALEECTFLRGAESPASAQNHWTNGAVPLMPPSGLDSLSSFGFVQQPTTLLPIAESSVGATRVKS